MLCEECKKNQATVIVTVTAGEEMTTRHLCPDCMKKMELSLAQGDIQSFLSSILSNSGQFAGTGAAEPDMRRLRTDLRGIRTHRKAGLRAVLP